MQLRRKVEVADHLDEPSQLQDSEVPAFVRTLGDRYVADLGKTDAALRVVAEAQGTADVVADYVQALVELNAPHDVIQVAATNARQVILEDGSRTIGPDWAAGFDPGVLR